jgi:hypothetical protein
MRRPALWRGYAVQEVEQQVWHEHAKAHWINQTQGVDAPRVVAGQVAGNERACRHPQPNTNSRNEQGPSSVHGQQTIAQTLSRHPLAAKKGAVVQYHGHDSSACCRNGSP